METRHLLAKNLKAIREARGLTQSQIGNVSQSTVSRIERAENATDIDVLTQVAGALGIDPWVLLSPNLDPKNLPVRALSRDEERQAQELKEAAQKFIGRLPV